MGRRTFSSQKAAVPFGFLQLIFSGSFACGTFLGMLSSLFFKFTNIKVSDDFTSGAKH